MRLMMLMTACAFASVLAMQGKPAAAQENLFAPRIVVNGRAITNYDYDQRVKFLKALHAPGDIPKLAEQQLIQDKLEMAEAEKLGIATSQDDIDQGMSDFASRAKLSADQFVTELEKEGVDKQTFVDFVRAGIAWRDVIRQKFSDYLDVSDADIDRALSLSAQIAPARVLLSELILPDNPEYAAQTAQLVKELTASIHTPEQFAAAARRYSASSSAPQGGKLDWMPLANLPPQIAEQLAALAPGQMSPPIPLQGAIGLFEMRGLQQGPSLPPAKVSVKYAQFLIPGGKSKEAMAKAQAIRATARTCNDMYGPAKGLPADRLVFKTQTMAQVPADIGLELAKLDAGETSANLVRNGDLDLIMLCYRRPADAKEPSKEDISNAIVNKRVNDLAESYLAKLQANAFIQYP